MNTKAIAGAALLCAAALAPISAGASTLDITATADNQFAVYLATASQIAANQLGTPIGSNPAGANWQTAFTLPSTPLAGSPLYLQVVVTNWTPNSIPPHPEFPNGSSNPSAFLADLSISGGGYVFTNGSASLSTNAVNWLGSTTSDPSVWVPTVSNAVSYGANNDPSTIWYGVNGGPVSGISGGADWIYFGDQATALYADLSTELIATPLPATWTMLLGGLLGFGWLACRQPKMRALGVPAA